MHSENWMGTMGFRDRLALVRAWWHRCRERASAEVPIQWLKLVISAAALIAIAAHLIFPDLKIDGITIGLFVVAILPWLTDLIESAKFPGGWEVKFRAIAEAGEQLKAASPAPQLPETQSQKPAQPKWLDVAEVDPNLAMVGLRIEIESRLRKYAQRHGLIEHSSLRRMIDDLQRRGVLDASVSSALDELTVAGNSAAHGAHVDPRIADWAILEGPRILAALDSLLA